ncbi:unnamed protein product [Symbiodinium sp. CCMP2592]|nr:unnamed protein product [Symbiodinium sp. CCMP2592]
MPNQVVLDVAQFQQILQTMQGQSQAVLAAAGAASTSRSSGTQGFSDANRILNRPACFGSTSHDSDLGSWLDWAHAFKAWLIFADPQYEIELQAIESNLDVENPTMPAETAERSRRLYAILSSLLQHKPKMLLRQVPDRNGYETWRQLVNIYAPRSKVRGLALLNAIMSFPPFVKSKTTREQVDGLDRLAQEYERVSGTAVNADILLGTLLRVLPAHLRNHIQLQMKSDTSYEQVKQFILTYEVTTSNWSASKVQQSLGIGPSGDPSASDPAPMDVDRAARVMVVEKVVELL